MAAKKVNYKIVPPEKSALSSVSLWGGFVAFLASAIEIVQDPSILAIIPEHVVPYVGAIGALIGIIGRVKAKKVISSFLPKK